MFAQLKNCHPEVKILWDTRNDELETQVFNSVAWATEKELTSMDDVIDLHKIMQLAMSDKEQKIIWLRFWSDQRLDEIGLIFGLSKERIRQIEKKFLRKFRYRFTK